MAERSFVEEVKKLRLSGGDVFRGEGILAVTKALLESGVSYVAGYQGAPISHLMDVLADAQPRLRNEVADVAARPAAQPALDGRGREAGLRAVRGQPHAGDAAAAHPRLPRAGPVHRRRQPARQVHAAGSDGKPAARRR